MLFRSLTNAISYGYKDDKKHEIKIIINLDAGRVLLDIIDDGAPFNQIGRASCRERV